MHPTYKIVFELLNFRPTYRAFTSKHNLPVSVMEWLSFSECDALMETFSSPDAVFLDGELTQWKEKSLLKISTENQNNWFCALLMDGSNDPPVMRDTDDETCYFTEPDDEDERRWAYYTEHFSDYVMLWFLSFCWMAEQWDADFLSHRDISNVRIKELLQSEWWLRPHRRKLQFQATSEYLNHVATLPEHLQYSVIRFPHEPSPTKELYGYHHGQILRGFECDGVFEWFMQANSLEALDEIEYLLHR